MALPFIKGIGRGGGGGHSGTHIVHEPRHVFAIHMQCQLVNQQNLNPLCRTTFSSFDFKYVQFCHES